MSQATIAKRSLRHPRAASRPPCCASPHTPGRTLSHTHSHTSRYCITSPGGLVHHGAYLLAHHFAGSSHSHYTGKGWACVCSSSRTGRCKGSLRTYSSSRHRYPESAILPHARHRPAAFRRLKPASAPPNLPMSCACEGIIFPSRSRRRWPPILSRS